MKRTAPLSDARSLSRVDLISLGVLLGILTGASRADAGRTDAGASEEAPRSRTIDVADSSSLRRALGDAEPGTTILLAPGDYEGGLSVEGPAARPRSRSSSHRRTRRNPPASWAVEAPFSSRIPRT